MYVCRFNAATAYQLFMYVYTYLAVLHCHPFATHVIICHCISLYPTVFHSMTWYFAYVSWYLIVCMSLFSISSDLFHKPWERKGLGDGAEPNPGQSESPKIDGGDRGCKFCLCNEQVFFFPYGLLIVWSMNSSCYWRHRHSHFLLLIIICSPPQLFVSSSTPTEHTPVQKVLSAYVDGLTGCPEDHVHTHAHENFVVGSCLCSNCPDELKEWAAIVSLNVKSVHVFIAPSELGPT